MNYYQDITLLPDTDIALGFLWQKIYQQVHIALVEQKIDEQHSAIAVGFPDYGSKGFPLGAKLRLFAEQAEQLKQLNIEGYLTRFDDYVHIKSIKEVPENASHVSFVRQKVKGQARIERDMQEKARLWSEKSGQPLEECLKQLEASKPTVSSKLPFIWLESQETKKRNPDSCTKFPLFINRIERGEPLSGKYSCYGLSLQSSEGNETATTPHF